MSEDRIFNIFETMTNKDCGWKQFIVDSPKESLISISSLMNKYKSKFAKHDIKMEYVDTLIHKDQFFF